MGEFGSRFAKVSAILVKWSTHLIDTPDPWNFWPFSSVMFIFGRDFLVLITSLINVQVFLILDEVFINSLS